MNLPPEYLQWLAKLGDRPCVEFDDVEWELATAAKLAESVSVDGRQAAFIEQTKLYAAALAKVMPHVEDADGNAVKFTRLEQFLTIGEQNEELLCVDPTDIYSVWTFLPGEGGLLDRVSKSLSMFMKKAKASQDE